MEGGKAAKRGGSRSRQDEWMKEQIVKREVRERDGESETDGIELGRPINTPSPPPSILDPLHYEPSE